MAAENGINSGNGPGRTGFPVLRIARPAENGPNPSDAEIAAENSRAESASQGTRTRRTATASQTQMGIGGEPAPKTTRVTKRDKAVAAAKNLVLTVNTGATLVAGPSAAMQPGEHSLIETGMVSLANQYPDKFIAGGNALGPGMLAIGCLMWIGRIIRDQRAAQSIAASLPPNPLAENWQAHQRSTEEPEVPQQPEWTPTHAPAVLTETPNPNGQIYEGQGAYDWVRQYTTLG
jgi:hypothetical protein